MVDLENFASNLTVTQRREICFSELKRRSRIRTLFKDYPIEEMREMIDRLEAVLEEKIKEEEMLLIKKAEAIKEAEAIIREMEKKGIDIRDIEQAIKRKTDNQVSEETAKYVKDGKRWGGRGRRPAEFRGLSDYELEKHRS
ncbi:H-NS family nucleoid-associated regulatory protein [Marinomonas algarum]|uniref:H-NS histone family protein n=1 Tax=Marinomonas algarum TaxID=2883105 RepID=A0A9X1LF48_9GAMM|nr:H-NS family nucleoid-associated regulatory protein [Marinomonas algarum]MCB5162611.1 H-NS histone family protein [Marinomonas algarum]